MSSFVFTNNNSIMCKGFYGSKIHFQKIKQNVQWYILANKTNKKWKVWIVRTNSEKVWTFLVDHHRSHRDLIMRKCPITCVIPNEGQCVNNGFVYQEFIKFVKLLINYYHRSPTYLVPDLPCLVNCCSWLSCSQCWWCLFLCLYKMVKEGLAIDSYEFFT